MTRPPPAPEAGSARWRLASAVTVVVAGLAVAGAAAARGQWPLVAVVLAVALGMAGWVVRQWWPAGRAHPADAASDPGDGGPAVLGRPPAR
jgi:hypothetical protein